jgi:hypothetical protein
MELPKRAAQIPGDQQENEQPTSIYPNTNSEQFTDAKSLAHSLPLSLGMK